MHRWATFSALLARFVESADLFHHRHNHASTVVGTYLYIDGGEITRWNGSGDGIAASAQCSTYNGAGCPGNIHITAENNTYSIDLTSSWTNATLIANQISKKAPVLKGTCLWVDGDNKTFYSYGGTSGGPGGLLQVPLNDLWQFTPSGPSGSWSQVPLVQPAQNFTTLNRVSGSGCTSGQGLGFSLGGVQSMSLIPSPGMTVYNTSSRLWYNVSAFGQPSGEFSYGAAQFVPSFGPEGLMIAIAGATPVLGSYDSILLDTSTVGIYEPVSQQWKRQAVTGAVPLPCQSTCVVGAEGEDGTYEIFQYGGFDFTNPNTSIGLGSVYVLSLPAFHWQKADYVPQFARFWHSCSAIGRQMFSVGGCVVTQKILDSTKLSVGLSGPDPWAQGIGVFDMTEMVWKDSYNAAASPYKTPAMVKQYYNSNPRYPASILADPVLLGWFKKEVNTPPPNTTSPSTPKPTSHKSDTAAIAGGVVGGVLGFTLIVGVIWWFLRRQSKQRVEQPSIAHGKAELEDTNHTGHRIFPGRRPISEAAGSPLHEMEGSKPLR